jgi:hypothetical protein
MFPVSANKKSKFSIECRCIKEMLSGLISAGLVKLVNGLYCGWNFFLPACAGKKKTK